MLKEFKVIKNKELKETRTITSYCRKNITNEREVIKRKPNGNSRVEKVE